MACMTVRVSHPRMRVRMSIVLRKEGGSLSMTIPRSVVRKWKLQPKSRLLIRSTDEGILLYPRYVTTIVRGPETPD